MCDCLTDAQDCADSRYNALYDVERPHPCECECHPVPETEPLKPHRWFPEPGGWRCLDCGCCTRSDNAKELADMHECDPWD